MTIFHPLARHEGGRHVITTYGAGKRLRVRTVHVPFRPPFSYALDPLVAMGLPRVDVWFGFNPLACARGLVARAAGRARTVVLWSVDFTPDRFGHGRLLTRAYDRVDRLCCLHADARIELSEAAREARDARHDIRGDGAPTYIVPMGTWLARLPRTARDGFDRKRVVFLGQLVRGKGVELLLDALARLDVEAEIVGGGPLEEDVRRRAAELGDRIHVHGFVPDHRQVEQILAGSSIAVAPYAPDENTYTRWADPGKLKDYLGAGLPIVLTDVPHNAEELAQRAGAELVEYDAAAIADAISRGLASPDRWRGRREAALRYAQRFDWSTLLPELLEQLGLNVMPAR